MNTESKALNAFHEAIGGMPDSDDAPPLQVAGAGEKKIVADESPEFDEDCSASAK